MNVSGQRTGVLRFGPFEVDLARAELRKGGALIKMQSQHFELLALLAGRAGQIVSREEIRRALWDDDTFVDFDRSINFGINQIRGALGDDPQSPRYVETLPRKGYRFIAPIAPSDAKAEIVSRAELTVASKPVAQGRRWWLIGAGIVAAIIA